MKPIRTTVAQGRLAVDEPTTLPDGTILELKPVVVSEPESVAQPAPQTIRDAKPIPVEKTATAENQFSQLGLIPLIVDAVTEEGYDEPTPIQDQTIPPLLAGRDLLGCAQTGSGKTAAFALPILQLLHLNHQRPKGRGRLPQVLVLSPTRELASQIGESFETYGRHTYLEQTTIFGGVNQNPQVRKLERGIDIQAPGSNVSSY